MAETCNSVIRRYNEAAARAQESKTRAAELRDSARSAARSLFQSADLRDFLDLVCRLNHYDAFNLLLILQQYPKASCLAGFKLWQKLLCDPNGQVLKPEWRGKGLDLVAPYTDHLGSGRYALTWFAVKQFDISQTNVTCYELPPSFYILDEKHMNLLQESLVSVIATEYHRSVVHIGSSAELRSTGLVGRMTDMTIQIRDDVRQVLRLQFLCQCLCRLVMEPHPNLDAAQTDLIIQYVTHCMFRIWVVNPPRPLHQPAVVLHSVPPQLQMDFLSLIQRTVRCLDESVCAAYRQGREGESLDFDLPTPGFDPR